MNNNPLVSIIAICYNHANYLKETLDSIKNQTYNNIQLIIMDDCSTDNSVDLINNWIYENKIECTFIAHKKNLGLCKTLNEALSYVRGDFFQGISCDDVLTLDKIEKNIEVFLEEDNSLALVYSDALVINEKSEIIFESYHDQFGIPKDEPQNYFEELLKGPLILAPTVLLRTKFVKESGYNENYYFEDWPMWLTLSYKYKFKRMHGYHIKYRYLCNSMSHGTKTKIKVTKSMIKLLNSWKGISPKYDKIIKNTKKHYLNKLISLDGTNPNLLFQYHKIEKSVYSFYLFICSIFFIKPSVANEFKKFIYK